MKSEIKSEFFHAFGNSLMPPYFGSMKEWAENNIVLPSEYGIPGKLNLDISPYLLDPLKAIENPKIMQVNLAMATRIGKTMTSEIALLYWIVNQPGPVMRIFHNSTISDAFVDTRLIPLLQSCDKTKLLLDSNKGNMSRKLIAFPHMSIKFGSADTALQHGLGTKYLIADELHQWPVGAFSKYLARTTDFIGHRKIICASQPNRMGSEWYNICQKGIIMEWWWMCPNCKKQQPFVMSKEREDGTYAGLNWETIVGEDGETTNIQASAKTAWLECIDCKHKVHDTPSERRALNDNGRYVCIKNDGDISIVTYMAPNFVNMKLSFEYAAVQYMLAKRQIKLNLYEPMEEFVGQVMGKFYKQEQVFDLSLMVSENYEKEGLDKEWTKIMSVDVQRKGNVKYYVIRAWHKNGNESRRIEFGVCREWSEIEAIREKHKIPLPLVGIDSGDGERTQEIYQECIKHGQVIKVNGQLHYVSWCPLKGDGAKASYNDHPDKVSRLYSAVSNKDAQFPQGHKLKGIPAPVILWSNISVKSILAQLRDNKIEGVRWKIDRPDDEYDQQMYSEDLKEVLDKKSGLMVQRWIQNRQDNHWLDTEAMNLVMAMRAGVFSATKINEEDMRKIIENSSKKDLSQ